MGPLLNTLTAWMLADRQSPITQEELAAQLLAENPDAEQHLETAAGKAPGGAIPTDDSGQFGHSGGDPYRVGLRLAVDFHPGSRGPEATVTAREGHTWAETHAVLIPERTAVWAPREGVRYRVELIRRIGQGRRQVWTTRPLGAAEDERWNDATQRADNVTHGLRVLLGRLERAEAAEWAREHLPLLSLQSVPVTQQATAPTLDRVVWEWQTHAEESAPAVFGRRPNIITRGIATATWGGLTGTYARTVTHIWETRQWESPDGGRREEDGWSAYETAEFWMSGHDVVAAREDALRSANEEFLRAADRARAIRAETHRALTALASQLHCGEMPDGSERRNALHGLACETVGVSPWD